MSESNQSERWQKVGIEEIRGSHGNLFKMAQVYVPNQEIGMNLYGPEWLIDRIIANHEEANALRAALSEAREEGFVEHRGSCQGAYGGECKCGFFAWEERHAAALRPSPTGDTGEGVTG